MRVAAHVRDADAPRIALAAEAILADAQAELDALGLHAGNAPRLTLALDVLGLAVASTQQLLATQSGHRPS